MADPIPQFSHLVREIAKHHSSLAYIHVVEPRVSGITDREVLDGEVCRVSLVVVAWVYSISALSSPTTSFARYGALGP